MSTVQCLQETTDWDEKVCGYRVPNHTYLVHGNKAYAYWKAGADKPDYFRTPFILDQKGRTFKIIPNIFDMSEVRAE